MIYSRPIRYLLYALLLLPATLMAQSAIILGDEGNQLVKPICFCTPGVIQKSKGKGLEIAYTPSLGHQATPLLSSDQTAPTKINSLDFFKFKFKVPFLNKEEWKGLLGYEYGSEVFRIGRTGGSRSDFFNELNEKNLKFNKFSLYLTRSFNHKFYGLFRFRAAFSGDYDGLVKIQNRYASYSAVGVFGIKPREDLEYGIGLSYSNNFFRNGQVLPFLVYNKTFNDNWGVEMAIPVQMMGRYNFNPRSMLLFGTELTSKTYSIDISNLKDGGFVDYHFRHAGVDLVATYERKLGWWLWMTLKGGYHIPVNTRVVDTVYEENSFDYSATGNLIFKIGLFISPDKEFIK